MRQDKCSYLGVSQAWCSPCQMKRGSRAKRALKQEIYVRTASQHNLNFPYLWCMQLQWLPTYSSTIVRIEFDSGFGTSINMRFDFKVRKKYSQLVIKIQTSKKAKFVAPLSIYTFLAADFSNWQQKFQILYSCKSP